MSGLSTILRCVLFAGTLSVLLLVQACSDDGSGGGSGTGNSQNDPHRGFLQNVNVPMLYCGGRGDVPLKVDIIVDSVLLIADYCWMEIYEDNFLEPGDIYDYESIGFTLDGQIDFTSSFDLPEGSYWVKVGLGQFPSLGTGADNYPYELWGPFRMTVGGDGCSSVVATMNIEYDCQRSWTLIGRNTVQYLDSSFIGANTLVQLWSDSLRLPDKRFFNEDSLVAYINQSYSRQFNMYLLGFEDLENRDIVDWRTPGFTLGAGPNSASAVARGMLVDTFTSYPYYWSLDEVWNAVDRTTAHELGHQRADLSHPWDAYGDSLSVHEPYPQFSCLMWGLILDQSSQLMEFLAFCDSCKARVRTVTW